MKVILDTNVLVSSIFFSGPPYRILEAWRKGKVQFILSSEIIDEYRAAFK
jgi:predicted nucleic acid-binding protein